MPIEKTMRRRRAARAAATEGRLEAAASNNPFAAGKTDVALSATADEAEAAAEGAAVALLAAERFAALLASNAERLGPHAGLKVCPGNSLCLPFGVWCSHTFNMPARNGECHRNSASCDTLFLSRHIECVYSLRDGRGLTLPISSMQRAGLARQVALCRECFICSRSNVGSDL